MWRDIVTPSALPAALTALVVGLWLLVLLAFALESRLVNDLLRRWRSASWLRRLLALSMLLAFTLVGADKTPGTVQQLLRMLFWTPGSPWQLATPASNVSDATAALSTASNDLAQVESIVTNNNVVTLSFDWHAPDRLPDHERQNILAWTALVVPTNIAGTLYEDHYVAFNAAASTNPAVILIEYAQRTSSGEILRYSSSVVTNSYPDRAVVNLQSGAHTCYWFRCEVPAAFTNSVRNWNGEALFGSPEGSGHGFDLLGTLVIDQGGSVWVGASTNIVMGGVSNLFQNGINITEGE